MAANTPPRGKRAHQIAADLRKLIDDKVVGPGDRLPTEAQLASKYGVTRPTVKQAYGKLVAAGDVISLGLGGYFVRRVEFRRWVLSREGSFVDPWTNLVTESEQPSGQEVMVEVVTAQRLVQQLPLEEWFELESGDPDEFIARDSLHTLVNRPVLLASAFVPSHIAEGTALRRPEAMEQSVIMFFEEELGRELTGCQDSVAGRMATDRETRLLELPENSFVTEVARKMTFSGEVLVVERLVFDTTGAQVISEVAMLSS